MFLFDTFQEKKIDIEEKLLRERPCVQEGLGEVFSNLFHERNNLNPFE